MLRDGVWRDLNFMLAIGPISSVFDFLTFGLLLWIFHASDTLFHTGWFVESLATHTLVLFVIRTAGHPLAGALGFTPLLALYFLLLIAMTLLYLVLVELVKRRLMRA